MIDDVAATDFARYLSETGSTNVDDFYVAADALPTKICICRRLWPATIDVGRRHSVAVDDFRRRFVTSPDDTGRRPLASNSSGKQASLGLFTTPALDETDDVSSERRSDFRPRRLPC